MSKPMTATDDRVRYRWMAAKRPPAFVPGYLIGRLLVEPLFARRGITVSSEGVEVHRMFSTRSLSWAEVRGIGEQQHAIEGRRLVLELVSGEEVPVPAPTANSAGDVDEARRRLESHLG